MSMLDLQDGRHARRNLEDGLTSFYRLSPLTSVEIRTEVMMKMSRSARR